MIKAAYISDIVVDADSYDFHHSFDLMAAFFRTDLLSISVNEIRPITDNRLIVTFRAEPTAAAPANADTLRTLFETAHDDHNPRKATPHG